MKKKQTQTASERATQKSGRRRKECTNEQRVDGFVRCRKERGLGKVGRGRSVRGEEEWKACARAGRLREGEGTGPNSLKTRGRWKAEGRKEGEAICQFRGGAAVSGSRGREKKVRTH